MPNPLLAPLIGAATSLGSSLIGNAGSKNSQNRANRQNIEFWRMQNKYNHPTAQMARLREAGLNPNMIYGTTPTSAVGNSEKIAPAKAADFNFTNPIHDISEFANLDKTHVQTDNLQAQNTVLKQEAILKAAQTGKTLSEGSSARTKALVDKALLNTSIDASKQNLRDLEQSTIGRQLDNEIKSKSKKAIMKDLFYKAEKIKSETSGSRLTNELRALEIELKKIGIERNDPWYFRILGRHLKTLDKARKSVKFKY